MNYFEIKHYHNLADSILNDGEKKQDRTGVGTSSLFGNMLSFNLFGYSLPVLPTRYIKPMDPIIEMLWFIAGDTDIAYLKKHKINIWDSWVREETKRFDEDGKLIGGSIGPGAYGAQWRNWEDTRIVDVKDLEKYTKHGYSYVTNLNETHIEGGTGKIVMTRNIDQLANAIELIKTNPDSRRIIVSAWNPGRIEDQALPPCHSFFQFYTAEMSTFEKVAMLKAIKKYSSERLATLYADGNFKTADQSFIDEIDDWLNKYQFNPTAADLEPLDDFIRRNKLPTRSLSMQLYCRSQDYLVGTVYNVAQYGALAHMVAQVTNTWAKTLSWVAGDTHVYKDQIPIYEKEHKPIAQEAATRVFTSSKIPRLILNPSIKNIDDFTPEDINVINYEPGPKIKYPIAV